MATATSPTLASPRRTLFRLPHSYRRMRTVTATRYVTPLREGGSLPAIVEADDLGLYVLKFRGAGQGVRTLIAELLAGELARALDLRVPEIVLIELDAGLARSEPDPEIQDLIRASAGLNLALDYLPGSATFDPLAEAPDAELASSIVWFDALVSNVDRTARNTNMLVWHRKLWLIDHGAAFFFHHAGDDFTGRAQDPFARIREHVLLRYASALAAVDAALAARLDSAVIDRITGAVPDSWLAADARPETAALQRGRYRDYLVARAGGPRDFVEEAQRARSLHL